MKPPISPLLLYAFLLGLLLLSRFYFERRNHEDIQRAETTLQEAGMPEAQVEAIRSAMLSVSRSAFSFAWIAGFMGLILGALALSSAAMKEWAARWTDRRPAAEPKPGAP